MPSYPRALTCLIAACTTACTVELAAPNTTAGVDGVHVGPTYYRIAIGDTLLLHATPINRECDIDFCRDVPVLRTVVWTSSDERVVAVTAGGKVRAVGAGTATVTATAERASATISFEIGTRIPLVTIGSGGHCGLSAAGELYCWGGLGATSTATGPQEPLAPRLMPGGMAAAAVSSSTLEACVASPGQPTVCWGALAPATDALAGFRFESVSVGDGRPRVHACGLTADGSAWCWGYDDHGQLGAEPSQESCNDGAPCAGHPVPVVGDARFSALAAGGAHTCGLTREGLVWCWGDNTWGQLGDGSTASRPTARPVEGLPPIAALTAGQDHTCALSREGATVCWGRNQNGQLGLASSDTLSHPQPRPVPVPRLVALDAHDLTCGLTSDGEAWCWGGGVTGPAAVANGGRFGSIGVGYHAVAESQLMFTSYFYVEEACAAALDGRVLCWDRSLQLSQLHGPAKFP